MATGLRAISNSSITSPFSKSPRYSTTPTESKLFRWAIAFTAPLSKTAFPAIKLPVASHFWRADKLASWASKTVPIFSSMASIMPRPWSKPKMTTLIPNLEASRVKVNLEIIPPKPVLEVSLLTTDKISESIFCTWRMISPLESNKPPTEVLINNFSAPNPVAIKVANSSLSENFNSTLLTTSFSLAIGITPFFQSS